MNYLIVELEKMEARKKAEVKTKYSKNDQKEEFVISQEVYLKNKR